MVQVRLYERVKDDEGNERWRKVGSLQHPGGVAAAVKMAAGALETMESKEPQTYKRIGRVQFENANEATGGLVIAPPKGAKKGKK